LLIQQSLHKELGEDEDAEFEEEDDTYTRRIRREYEKRVGQYEERLHELDKDMQKKIDHQAELLEKIDHQADDAQRGAVAMLNEQKRYESHIQRLQSDAHRSSSAVDKMRFEVVSLRRKINDLRDQRSNLERQLHWESWRHMMC
jgi:phage shock protein A